MVTEPEAKASQQGAAVTKSRIASPVPRPESSLRHLPLVDLLVDAKTELLKLAHVGDGANRLDDDAVRPDTMEPFIKVPKGLGDGEGA